MIWTGNAIDIEREVFIGFDLLLVLVLGLLLYAISARDSQAPPGRFVKLRLLLVLCALVVDILASWAMVERTSEFGFSPNKKGGARPEPLAPRKPRLVGRALRTARGETRAVQTARALADGLSFRVCRLGVDRGGALPDHLQIPMDSPEDIDRLTRSWGGGTLLCD